MASNTDRLGTVRTARGAAGDRDFERGRAGEIDRIVPSGLIEQWAMFLRRERSRAVDLLWLIDQGFTLHDGRDGIPMSDATARNRGELEITVAEVSALLAQYDAINLRHPVDHLG